MDNIKLFGSLLIWASVPIFAIPCGMFVDGLLSDETLATATLSQIHLPEGFPLPESAFQNGFIFELMLALFFLIMGFLIFAAGWVTRVHALAKWKHLQSLYLREERTRWKDFGTELRNVLATLAGAHATPRDARPETCQGHPPASHFSKRLARFKALASLPNAADTPDTVSISASEDRTEDPLHLQALALASFLIAGWLTLSLAVSILGDISGLNEAIYGDATAAFLSRGSGTMAALLSGMIAMSLGFGTTFLATHRERRSEGRARAFWRRDMGTFLADNLVFLRDAGARAQTDARRIAEIARTLLRAELDHCDGDQRGILLARLAEDGWLRPTGTLSLVEMDFSGAQAAGATLCRVDLSGVNLSHAILTGADLSHSSMAGAGLTQTDLKRAQLRGADLRHARLDGARLHYADLEHADLRRASLRRTNLFAAKLVGARYETSSLTSTQRSQIRGSRGPDERCRERDHG